MNNFRTVVSVSPSQVSMSLASPVMTIGSCFADVIGNRLQSFKMRSLANPFGTVYNPDAIHKALRYAIFNEPPPAHTFLQNGDIHLNYDFHSALSSMTRLVLESQLTEIIGMSHAFLKDAAWLMITYGTAWVYTRNDTGELVSNCHKMPGTQFTKSLPEAYPRVVSASLPGPENIQPCRAHHPHGKPGATSEGYAGAEQRQQVGAALELPHPGRTISGCGILPCV